jgi:mannose-1-phosphate guanylyltransferase/mannose-6-phosphate isomerase
LTLVGQDTLFVQSVSRAMALEDNNVQLEEILIVANENHRFIILEQLETINIKTPYRILLEPEPRNTAPALTLSAVAAFEKNPDSLLIVMPADHYIKSSQVFIDTIRHAVSALKDRQIITLGIPPNRPDTGFGYIEYQGNKTLKNVLSFKEKPNLDSAKLMIKKGKHVWNSGIFILESKTWLDAIQKSDEAIYRAIDKSWRQKSADQSFTRPDDVAFKLSPSDSIDYAVIEKSKELTIDLKLMLLNAGWSDLGSFSALDEIEGKDDSGNIIKGDVVILNSKNNIVTASKRNVSLLGVSDLIIVETADSVLVAQKNEMQNMKSLVDCLEVKHSHLVEEHVKVSRPWGYYETLDVGRNFKVKKIVVKSGAKLSYQSHEHRSEHWVVIKGVASVRCDEEEYELCENESTFIKRKAKHQLRNKEDTILEIIEVQLGEKVLEEDITRYEDIYGRL